MRRFALEFSGAAEGLGYNDAALKDLFNSALDEPLSWWRMRGLDHLNFGQICGFFGTFPIPGGGRRSYSSSSGGRQSCGAPCDGRRSCSAPWDAEAGM